MQEESWYRYRNRREKILCNGAKRSLKLVEQVNNEALRNKFLDSQWFLDYHDDLNRLSIDEDRKDTIIVKDKAGGNC